MSSASDMATEKKPKRYIDGLNEGMALALEEDETVVVIGIDVGAGGGIFRVTKGLHERFGDERVIDAPISEMGYVGAAVGAAMTGLRPIVEIMFMDFVGVCMDPILNQAAKLRYMTAGALEIPVVFRMQTGAGKSAGAQHSQSLEAWFAHIPGLKVAMPATVADARDLMLDAVRDPNPVVFVENRRLYGMREDAEAESGEMLRECLQAAEESDSSLEVIDLRSLAPLDMETVIASVQKTQRLLIVHEAVQDFGGGAEIAARVGDQMFDELRTPVRRLGAPPVPMPFSPELERSLMPTSKRIAETADALRAEG
jgi:pyruvate/2-oxoglutarate/acetoin dehydrogenase E1 component